VVVGRRRIGNEDCGPSGDRDFGHRGSACARDQQLAPVQAVGQIGEEGLEHASHTIGGVDLAHPAQVLGTALLHDRQASALGLGQARDRLGHDFGQNARALTAAQHQ
jgi:hypothetical protein